MKNEKLKIELSLEEFSELKKIILESRYNLGNKFLEEKEEKILKSRIDKIYDLLSERRELVE